MKTEFVPKLVATVTVCCTLYVMLAASDRLITVKTLASVGYFDALVSNWHFAAALLLLYCVIAQLSLYCVIALLYCLISLLHYVTELLYCIIVPLLL